jgi:murein endopeptidase
VPGGWRGNEVWLDTDEVRWFGELARSIGASAARPQPLLAGGGGALAVPAAPAVAYPRTRPRRAAGPSRRRRIATRLFPLAAGVVAVGAMALTYLWPRTAAELPALPPAPATAALEPLAAEPESVASTSGESVPVESAEAAAQTKLPAQRNPYPAIHWRKSQAVGLPQAGRLLAGVALPVKGPGWVTWDPVLDRRPNRANRLHGTDRLVRVLLNVIAEYRAAHPHAAPLVIGDLSLRGGGEIDDHASHENGLDADVYYPRRDGRPKPPATVAQVDMRLAQELVDRFVAAGAQMVFVGPNTSLRGPAGVVQSWPAHDNHLHVRLGPTPGAP